MADGAGLSDEMTDRRAAASITCVSRRITAKCLDTSALSFRLGYVVSHRQTLGNRLSGLGCFIIKKHRSSPSSEPRL